jgi:hypothetical protein
MHNVMIDNQIRRSGNGYLSKRILSKHSEVEHIVIYVVIFLEDVANSLSGNDHLLPLSSTKIDGLILSSLE